MQEISASGGNVKVTAYMVGRWVKAAFLVILGIVILLYSSGIVEDFRSTMESIEERSYEDGGPGIDLTFEWVWDLLTILLWILVAWLFVLAALNIAYGFQEAKYSNQVILKRLDRIDRRLGIRPETTLEEEAEEEEESKPEIRQPQAVSPAEDDIPPPPKE